MSFEENLPQSALNTSESSEADPDLEQARDNLEKLNTQQYQLELIKNSLADTPEDFDQSTKNDSGTALVKRLKDLGVDITNNQEGDIGEVAKAVQNKLNELDQQIIAEKMTTLEGRLEIKEGLVQELSESLPPCKVKQTESGFAFTIGQQFIMTAKIDVTDRGAVFTKPADNLFTPGNLDTLQDKYDQDIVEEALREAYQNSITKALASYDESLGKDSNKLLIDVLEKTNLEAIAKVHSAFQKHDQAVEDFKSFLKSKNIELAGKDINFSDVSISGFGGRYDDFYYTEKEGSEREKIENSIYHNTFPPKFDYVYVAKKVTEITDHLSKLKDLVDSLDTKDKVYNFGVSAELKDWHMNYLSTTMSGLGKPSVYLGYKYKGVLDKYQSFYDASQASTARLAANEKAAQQASELIITTIKTQAAKQNLLTLSKQYGLGGYDVNEVPKKIDGLKRRKEEAGKFLSEIATLKTKLANQRVVLDGLEITVVSTWQELQKKQAQLKELNTKIKEKTTTLNNHKKEKLNFFGRLFDEKSKDRATNSMIQELSDLEAEQSSLETEIQTLSDKSYFKIPDRLDSSLLSSLIDISEDAKLDTADNVLKTVTDKLNAVLQEKMPPDLLLAYQEFKELDDVMKNKQTRQ